MEKSIELKKEVHVKQKARREIQKSKYLVYLGIALATVFASGFSTPFYQGLIIEMMVFGLLAISLDLLLGYTGLLSFGHAAFFGLSAYTTGILMNQAGLPFFASLFFAVLVTVVVAAIIGMLCGNLNGIQFSMLTLAFGQLIWTIATQMRGLTNGLDGFSINQGTTVTIGGTQISLADPQVLLYITAILLILSYWSIQRIVASSFGQALLAIKENEERSKFLGFNPYRIKVQVFVLSAFYASLAGGCFVLLKMFVAPDYLHWSFSGNVLMMTLLGGIGTLTGPLLGAVSFVWFQDWVSSMTEHWMAYIGIIFILVVFYLPKGVFGWLFKK